MNSLTEHRAFEILVVHQSDVPKLTKCLEAIGLRPRLIAHSQTHEGACGMARILEEGNFDGIREVPGVH